MLMVEPRQSSPGMVSTQPRMGTTGGRGQGSRLERVQDMCLQKTWRLPWRRYAITTPSAVCGRPAPTFRHQFAIARTRFTPTGSHIFPVTLCSFSHVDDAPSLGFQFFLETPQISK